METADSGHSPCIICGKDNFQKVFVCRDHFVSGEQFPILECTSCGFRKTGEAPGASEIGHYYQSKEYISHSNTHKGIINTIYHSVRSVMLRQKLQIIRRCTGLSKGNLLDVGTGTGYFLHFAGQNGWKVTGVEKSEEARQFASDQFGLKVLPDEDFFSLSTESFDVVTLWHVLEHLHEPARYWQKFNNVLKPGGFLIIALPNPTSYDARHYKTYWAAYDVPRHLWHFSPGNVSQAAMNAGFSLIETYRMPFDAFYVSLLSEKYRKSAFPFFSGLLHGKISWIVSLFDRRRCSSLIYILKKA